MARTKPRDIDLAKHKLNEAYGEDLSGLNYEQLSRIPCDVLASYPDDLKDKWAFTVTKHFVHSGFPHYEMDGQEVQKHVLDMMAFDESSLELGNGVLNQNMMGLKFCNFFHPQMWSVRCRNKRSPMEVFEDPDRLKEAIRKRMEMSDTPLLPYNIRKSLKVFGGVLAVSNFRPTIAKYIYQKYCPEGGKALDPCSGYSGRLFGAMCSHIGEYVGIDPSRKAFENGGALMDSVIWANNRNNETMLFHSTVPEPTLIQSPYEEWSVFEQRFDLVFTSPPYFNVEKYSQEPDQSYIKFPEYDQWKEGFLTPLVHHSDLRLKPGGYFIINIQGSPWEEDLVEIASRGFGDPVEVLQMRLSKIMGSHKKKGSHKLEPIYVWKKGS